MQSSRRSMAFRRLIMDCVFPSKWSTYSLLDKGYTYPDVVESLHIYFPKLRTLHFEYHEPRFTPKGRMTKVIQAGLDLTNVENAY